MYSHFIGSLIVGLILCGCTKDSNPSEPDFTVFKYLNFDTFRRTSPDTSFDIAIKTMIIRRPNFKRGVFSVQYDSVLKESIPVCSPLTYYGDTVCPTYYQYFLVDSVWFVGNTEDKFLHRIELQKAYLADTTILDASRPKNSEMVSEPPIPQLDRLLDKPLYTKITITKRRVPSHDGINYSIDVHGDLHEFWMR